MDCMHRQSFVLSSEIRNHIVLQMAIDISQVMYAFSFRVDIYSAGYITTKLCKSNEVSQAISHVMKQQLHKKTSLHLLATEVFNHILLGRSATVRRKLNYCGVIERKDPDFPPFT